MTLIVSVVSDDIIFQVSDRRVTVEHNGERYAREEPLTKAVVFCDRAIFGFTGRAEVDLQRSDLWIAHQLKDATDLADGLNRMRSRLSEIFRRPQYRQGHTITTAGYKINEDGTLTPFYAMVTNQFRDRTWLPKPDPVHNFELIYDPAPGNAVGVFAAPGGWISHGTLMTLQENVASADSFETAVDLVVTAVRTVAAQHIEVGSDLLLSVLPRHCVGRRQVMWLTGGPPGETPSFHYLPADDDPVTYGPTLVCGGAISTGFTLRPLSDEERTEADGETRDFRKAGRPQHAYLVPVRSVYDPAFDMPTREPDAGVPLSGASFYYHPNEDIALVLISSHLDGFPELTSLEELLQLSHEWNGAFDVQTVSEITGIGWVEP